MQLEAFQPPGPPQFFPGAENQELATSCIRRINLEFKDLAQAWRRKIITVHEKDVPLIIKCISQQILLSGCGGLKPPSSMGKTNPPRSFDSALQTVCHAINLRGAALRMTILWENRKRNSRSFHCASLRFHGTPGQAG
jgi:hypothetical protein